MRDGVHIMDSPMIRNRYTAKPTKPRWMKVGRLRTGVTGLIHGDRSKGASRA